MSKKKICFISLGNLYLCPYINKYISMLECDFDIIYWDRHGIEETIAARGDAYVFRYNMEEGNGKIKKAGGYIKFRKFAKNILIKNNYDGVILLQTSVGILLGSLLKNKYNKKYIVDIRDYTMEKNPIFYSLTKRLINNATFAVISSKGYENFLPNHNYIIVHNDTKIDDIILSKFQNKERRKNKIVISYIGLIRFHEQNKKMILKFKNDNRFILRFIGKDAFALSEFCQINEVSNVELIDQFPPDSTLDFYYETDIIYNLYGNNTPLLDYALSNKLYYAAKLKIPILVSPGTYMEKVSVENGFGYVFDFNDTEASDKLFNYYNSINWDNFNRECENFVKKIEIENLEFENMVIDFINKI